MRPPTHDDRAALWDAWHDKSANKQIALCAMVITEPSKFVADIHDRMPVILELEHFDTWMRTDDLREAAGSDEANRRRRAAKAAGVQAGEQLKGAGG